jgi:hypothetical protein
MAFFEFLKSSIEGLLANLTVFEGSGAKILCWFVHTVRVLYNALQECVAFGSTAYSHLKSSLRDERIKVAVQCVKLILDIKPRLDSSTSLEVKFAMIKAVQTVSRSLLSKRLSIHT